MKTLGYKAHLGALAGAVETTLNDLTTQRIVARIWARDHTVWKPEPAEITNRLGWLTIMEPVLASLPDVDALVSELYAENYAHAILLGMGGSSLAPDVFRRTFGTQSGYLELGVLDSTDPGAVAAYADAFDLHRTLFVVATKSGGTVETLSAFKYFYNELLKLMPEAEARRHFIAITDPGSGLAQMASDMGFRKTFLNDPNIGGRFSVMSHFGMVPATLLGLDVSLLLTRAQAMAVRCGSAIPPAENPGAWLGVVVGAAALGGRDKLTFIISPTLESFGDWVEQLIAESTGKDGKGILPVVGEPVGAPFDYGVDRFFVYLRLDGDGVYDAEVAALVAAGYPVLQLNLADRYDLGGQFFLWEMATAVAGHCLGIQPFDQPNVEAAKVQARKFVKAYQEQGVLPDIPAVAPDAAALRAFVAQGKPGDYLSIHAYVTPTPETDAALLKLRVALRDATRLAVTTGYGPRFLHSTGQLHKGDAGNGLFVQIISDAAQDLPIPDAAGQPDAALTFDVLKKAQALGDHQALTDANRRVLRVAVGVDAAAGIAALTG